MTARRRWWLIGLVAVWIAVVAVLAVWSVGHERATVPEQRDLGLAVADLQRATGVVYAAADGDGRAVVLGELQFSPDCRITPVRSGRAASRTVTVHVADGRAGEVLDDVAARLPTGYQADVGRSHGGTRLSLHADAGDFVGIDMSGESVATAFTLRLTTGCRPDDGDAPGSGVPSHPAAPSLLYATVKALGGGGGEADVQTFPCPAGGVAGSWTVGDVRKPADVRGKLRGVGVVHLGETEWSYRRDGLSLVVLSEGTTELSVTVSTGCR